MVLDTAVLLKNFYQFFTQVQHPIDKNTICSIKCVDFLLQFVYDIQAVHLKMYIVNERIGVYERDCYRGYDWSR